ncbi:hypothetical protein BH20ACT16_BH20ACT16_11780 [soil metagenome]
MSNTATIAPTGTWTVDASHSKVAFAVKHLGIATVRGEFGKFEGTFEIGDDLSSSRAYGVVKTTSIDTNDKARDEHLRAPDFFEAESHPSSRPRATPRSRSSRPRSSRSTTRRF